MPQIADLGVVLIVEDECICKLLRSVLSRAGYQSLELQPQEARELIRSGRYPIEALITNTPEVFHEFAHGLPLLYTTSCPDPSVAREFENCRIVQKPFHGAQLLTALHEVSDLVIR